MKFFPTRTILQSEKNGTIEVREWLWFVRVYTGGFEQSGPYVSSLWNDAVQKVQNREHVRSVLVIGLGLGGSVRAAEKQFRGARIVALEWDRVMIDLARKYKWYTGSPHVIHGDIRDVLPSLSEKFDVVLADAFFGDTPDVGAEGDTTGQALVHVLAQGGCYILNSSRTPRARNYMSRFLTLQKTWRFRDNEVSLFVH